jgi:hypothetical protein
VITHVQANVSDDGDDDASHRDGKQSCHTIGSDFTPHASKASLDRAAVYGSALAPDSDASTTLPGVCHGRGESGSNPCDQGRGDSSDCKHCDGGLIFPDYGPTSGQLAHDLQVFFFLPIAVDGLAGMSLMLGDGPSAGNSPPAIPASTLLRLHCALIQ